MKQIFVDVETTGLNPNSDNITQLGLIYKKNGKVVCRKNFKSDIKYQIIKFLSNIIDPYNKDDKAYLLGWNSKFDSEFLHRLINTSKVKYGNFLHHYPIDIQAIFAHKSMYSKKKPENLKLETVARFLNIKVNSSNFHDAEYDIDITNKIYLKIK